MEYIYERVLNARTVLGQAYEISGKITNKYDKYTVLKSGYGQACVLVPDNLNIAGRPKLHVTPVDEYLDKLNNLRSQNIDSLNYNKKLDKQYHTLQNAAIDFQKFALGHGERYIDNLYLLDNKGQTKNMDLQMFQDYLDPYYKYLQQLYRKVRKNNLI